MQLKLQQKKNYDRRHRARPLPPLSKDTPVWVNTQDREIPGRAITSAATPRSYIVDTSTGHVQRNRQHNVPDPQDTEPDDPPMTTTVERRVTRSQSGLQLQPLDRLKACSHCNAHQNAHLAESNSMRMDRVHTTF